MKKLLIGVLLLFLLTGCAIDKRATATSFVARPYMVIEDSFLGNGISYLYEEPSSAWKTTKLSLEYQGKPVFYVNNLNEFAVLLYHVFENDFENRDILIITPKTISELQVYYLLYAIMPDNIDLSTLKTNIEVGSSVVRVLQVNWFRMDDNNYQEMVAFAKEFADNMEEGITDRQKVRLIHDYLIKNAEYDNYAYNHIDDDSIYWHSSSPFAIIMEKKGMCLGYSKAFFVMARAAGIPVLTVTGIANGGGHAWNLVYLEGEWYQIDLTFDDPVPDVKGRTNYDYYLRAMSRGSWWNHTYDTYPFSIEEIIEIGNQLYGLSE
ncbi:MAG: hypothetical protein LBR25_03660 [Erysipelotrichaceae bacterium]|jgi:transglutaminase-like putative cysteine protease|nr:hypothetical protein [Erysipelotrichaceae bacterium]